MITSFREILKKAKSLEPKTISVASAEDVEVLRAVEQARQERLVQGILIGDKKIITEMAIRNNIDPRNYEIINEPDKAGSARLSVLQIREKKQTF